MRGLFRRRAFDQLSTIQVNMRFDVFAVRRRVQVSAELGDRRHVVLAPGDYAGRISHRSDYANDQRENVACCGTPALRTLYPIWSREGPVRVFATDDPVLSDRVMKRVKSSAALPACIVSCTHCLCSGVSG